MRIPRRALLKTYSRDSLVESKEIVISTSAWRHLLACKSPYEHDDLPVIGSNQEIVPLAGAPVLDPHGTKDHDRKQLAKHMANTPTQGRTLP